MDLNLFLESNFKKTSKSKLIFHGQCSFCLEPTEVFRFQQGSVFNIKIYSNCFEIDEFYLMKKCRILKIKNDVAMFCFKNTNLLVFPNKQFFTRNTESVYLLQTLLDYFSFSRDYETEEEHKEPTPEILRHAELPTVGDVSAPFRLFPPEINDTNTLKRKWAEAIDMVHDLHIKLKNQSDVVNEINDIARKVIELKRVKIEKESITSAFYSMF
ncbi:hypothetical protein HDV06_005440 [Boothiomyces sp. JEL0866]|nr:hypothetical protein HDV06_005440 [Boothiomyces sp. JEL0866]